MTNHFRSGRDKVKDGMRIAENGLRRSCAIIAVTALTASRTAASSPISQFMRGLTLVASGQNGTSSCIATVFDGYGMPSPNRIGKLSPDRDGLKSSTISEV